MYNFVLTDNIFKIMSDHMFVITVDIYKLVINDEIYELMIADKMYKFVITVWVFITGIKKITKWKLLLNHSNNDRHTCLPFLGSAYGGRGSRYSDGTSPTPLPHHHWSLLLSPQTQHKSFQNSCQTPSSFLLSKTIWNKI